MTFRFAAYLLTLPVDHTLYANFDEVFTVFLAIILGSLTAGQASTALPLATQATAAASKLQTVMTTAEGEVWEGRQLVSYLLCISAEDQQFIAGRSEGESGCGKCILLLPIKTSCASVVSAVSFCGSWRESGAGRSKWSWQVNRLLFVGTALQSWVWAAHSG